jgi:hypothetical protein
MLLPLLASCNVHTKNPAKGDENVSIHADESGHIAFNLPIAEGQVKVPAGMMHNGNFDIDGVKLVPGSSVTGFNLDASHGKFASTGEKVLMRCYAYDPSTRRYGFYVTGFIRVGAVIILLAVGLLYWAVRRKLHAQRRS